MSLRGKCRKVPAASGPAHLAGEWRALLLGGLKPAEATSSADATWKQAGGSEMLFIFLDCDGIRAHRQQAQVPVSVWAQN